VAQPGGLTFGFALPLYQVSFEHTTCAFDESRWSRLNMQDATLCVKLISGLINFDTAVESTKSVTLYPSFRVRLRISSDDRSLRYFRKRRLHT